MDHDLYLDLPLAPWEAALGASVEVPTLAGAVTLKVPAGYFVRAEAAARRAADCRNRAAAPAISFAVAQIVVPATLSERERELYQQLAETAGFNPRRDFGGEGS